jgi:hypothetical protein
MTSPTKSHRFDSKMSYSRNLMFEKDTHIYQQENIPELSLESLSVSSDLAFSKNQSISIDCDVSGESRSPYRMRKKPHFLKFKDDQAIGVTNSCI